MLTPKTERQLSLLRTKMASNTRGNQKTNDFALQLLRLQSMRSNLRAARQLLTKIKHMSR